MIEVADVFRRFAADYLSAHGASMLPSHRRAIEDILDCRTAALGGQVWRCDACGTEVFSWHSCGNRSCPKCHTAQTREWLEHRQAEMLPVPYFHITVTVPAELREVLRANQRNGYGVLMQASAAAITELARDPRYVGGTVGVLAVLHTWTQQPQDSPHLSDRPENVCEERLVLQHLREALHQRAQPSLRHRRDQIVKHASLTEQRVDTALGGVGLQHPVIAQCLTGGT